MKYYWFFDSRGVIHNTFVEAKKTSKRKQFGNYFKSEEEVTRAVKLVKIWLKVIKEK